MSFNPVHVSASILNVVCGNLCSSTIAQVMGRSRTEPIWQNGEKISFHCGDAPALVPLVADAGVKREHILAGVRKTAAVCLADLADIRHMVGAGTQLGGQGDLIADIKRVDLPKVAVGTAVMGKRARHIALPDGGILKMSNAFGKRLAVRSLTDPHTRSSAGISSLPREPFCSRDRSLPP